MNKVCYICGRTIVPHSLYYKVGTNSYVCSEKWCYEQYFWDNYLARYVVDRNYECVVIDGIAYAVGNGHDEPRGFSGREFTIKFNDGTIITTHSLWLKGEVPTKYLNVLKDNAKFVGMGEL